MSEFVNKNFINDLDSLVDHETFDSKYVKVSDISTADEVFIINELKFVKSKCLNN